MKAFSLIQRCLCSPFRLGVLGSGPVVVKGPTNKGAIAGGVVGGVVGLSVIVALVFLFQFRRWKQNQAAGYQQQTTESGPWSGYDAAAAGSRDNGIARELPATEVRGELEAQSKVRAELWGDDLRSHELSG